MNDRENNSREQHLGLNARCPIWWVTVNGGSPTERQATEDIRINRRLGVGMVVVMLGVFIGLDWVVLGMVQGAIANDAEYIAAKLILPDQRLISENVYMSLIGATVLQAKVIMAAISYLFPTRRVA